MSDGAREILLPFLAAGFIVAAILFLLLIVTGRMDDEA